MTRHKLPQFAEANKKRRVCAGGLLLQCFVPRVLEVSCCLRSWLRRCPHVSHVPGVGFCCGSRSINMSWTSSLQLERERRAFHLPHHTFLETRAMGATLSITAARCSISMVAGITEVEWTTACSTPSYHKGRHRRRRRWMTHQTMTLCPMLRFALGSVGLQRRQCSSVVAVEHCSSSMFFVPCPKCLVHFQ